ncbi:MAG: hypothetical protein JXR37_14825 [Kiritimatiellae bacterium]|nr:hypothetical protein [Kiritimatiellia bacterium]
MRRHVPRLHLFCLLAAVTTAWGGTVESTESMTVNGTHASRLDIVLIGDGFTSAEMDSYRNYTLTARDRFLAHEPFGYDKTSLFRRCGEAAVSTGLE